MRESNFLTLLRTLSTKELKEFDHYLHCFYVNRNRELTLFKYVMECKKPYASKKLERSTVIANCFPDENLTEKNLFKNIIHPLNTYLENFLVQKKIISKEKILLKNQLLLEIYQERELEKEYETHLKYLKKTLDKSDQNMRTYLSLFEINYFDYFSSSNDKKSIVGTIMQDLMGSLDGFFISAKLKLACEQTYRERIINKKVSIHLLEEAHTLAQTSGFNQNELLQVYVQLLSSLKHDCPASFNESLQELIELHYTKESAKDQPTLYGFLFNYLAGKAKEDIDTYKNNMSRCIEFGLDEKIFYTGKYIEPVLFNGLVSFSYTYNAKLATKILDKYSSALKPIYKNDTLLMAKCYRAFSKGDYAFVALKLRDIKFKHTLSNMTARCLLIMALIEKKDYGKIEQAMLNFNAFIKRQKHIGNNNKESALNTLKFFKQLSVPNIDVEKYRKEIEETTLIFHKAWFLGGLNKMKENNKQ